VKEREKLKGKRQKAKVKKVGCLHAGINFEGLKTEI
jgi:hypothetical protein